MNKLVLFLVIQCLMINYCFAQTLTLDEKTPTTNNGFEYGYVIKNEQIKSAKGDDYSRYEISLYIINKSGCSKYYANKTNIFNNDSPDLLATFNCINANGKRLTAKSGTIKAKEFYVRATVKEDGKEATKSVKAGYMFRNNETLKTNIIVLVPIGEKPNINCTINQLEEY